MVKQSVKTWVLLVLMFVRLGVSYAESPANTATQRYEFEQELEGELGGKVLKPGVYRIVITYEGQGRGKLAVFKKKQLLVEVPCSVEKSDFDSRSNAVAYNRNDDGRRVPRWVFIAGRQERLLIQPAKASEYAREK